MMHTKINGLRIEVIESEEGFLAIKDEWDALIDKSINPTFYSTYPFVFTVWKNFKNENNRLFILLVRRDAVLVGIAPFRIECTMVGKIRLFRKIKYIAEWGEGDKPSIISTEKQSYILDRIFQFLNGEFTQWDEIQLMEQPENSPFLKQSFFGNKWYSTMVVPKNPSFYISIAGTWEEYLMTRGKNTHKTWTRYRKKLYDLSEGVLFQCYDDPEFVSESLKRFIAIEQSGWKKGQEFSVGGNEKKKRFYEELLVLLVHKKMAAIYLLTSGTTDIAGIIVYKYNSIVYMAHITYRPTYAKYSPGIILNAEIIKTLFGTIYHEYDFLIFERKDEKSLYKKKWSTGSRQTMTIKVSKRNIRRFLFILEECAKKVLLNIMRRMTKLSKYLPY
ncbi:MAG: GNAT family N-acetyltransferase [Methanoregula sp.]|nr:GNAT family N-acetyltransferase [Methanoregula sp.]